jgi:hypothetical protein
MKYQSSFRVATTAALAIALLLTSGGVVFASDTATSSSKNGKIVKVVLTPAQIATLQATLTSAKATLVDARTKAQVAHNAYETLKASLEPDLQAAMVVAIAAAKTAAGIVTPDPTAVATAKATALAAKTALDTAFANVKAAQLALKANPTDATLQVALTAARTAMVGAQATVQSTHATLEALFGNDKPKVKLDIKAIRATTMTAFLASHPAFATAQAADKAAYGALKVAAAALKAAQDALHPNRSGKDKGQMGTNTPGAGQDNMGDKGNGIPSTPTPAK